MTLLNILLMAPQGGSNSSTWIMFLLIFVVMYFFMFYPQIKQRKAQKKFREELKEGDKIVTLGGIHAKIERMDDTTIVINSDGTRLRIDKSAISMEQSQALNAPKKEEKK